jgi:dCMP deaminase
MHTRPTWHGYFLGIAREVSRRSTCIRAQYGAVVVDPSHAIISTGYNGAPVGITSCYERQQCVRNELGIPSGMNYELCKSVHAETNAIVRARTTVRGCDLYIGSCNPSEENNEPCDMCQRMMINAGIRYTIFIRNNDLVIADPHQLYQIHNYGGNL